MSGLWDCGKPLVFQGLGTSPFRSTGGISPTDFAEEPKRKCRDEAFGRVHRNQHRVRERAQYPMHWHEALRLARAIL